MVNYLLTECKLDPNVQDNYGDTALHDAGAGGALRCRRRAGQRASARRGAAKFGHAKVVKALIDNKVDVHIKNNNHQVRRAIGRDAQRRTRRRRRRLPAG